MLTAMSMPLPMIFDGRRKITIDVIGPAWLPIVELIPPRRLAVIRDFVQREDAASDPDCGD